jgi:hypothetical protein
MFIIDPHVSLSLTDAQNLFNRMQMIWRTVSWIAPLLEQA